MLLALPARDSLLLEKSNTVGDEHSDLSWSTSGLASWTLVKMLDLALSMPQWSLGLSSTPDNLCSAVLPILRRSA